MNTKKAAPIRQVRFGRARVAIWSNESEHGPYESATVSNLYRDKTGKWADSSSWTRDQIPALIQALTQAWISMHQSAPATKHDEEVPTTEDESWAALAD